MHHVGWVSLTLVLAERAKKRIPRKGAFHLMAKMITITEHFQHVKITEEILGDWQRQVQQRIALRILDLATRL
jgi:hypothetical protein